jgi:hypothetical protein
MPTTKTQALHTHTDFEHDRHGGCVEFATPGDVITMAALMGLEGGEEASG